MSCGQMEAFCTSVVKRIKDTFDWPGDIKTVGSLGAWTGEIPNYLKLTEENDSTNVDSSSHSGALENMDEDIKSAAQDIASYQVPQPCIYYSLFIS